MDLSFEHNLKEAERGLSEFARKQIPFAAMLAINDTLKDIKTNSVKMLRRRLNNPSRWTLRSLHVWRAKKRDLRGRVGFKEFAGKGIAAGKYLDHMETGGPRGATRFELALRHAGVLQEGEYVVRAKGAKITRGTFTRVLSQLGGLAASGGNASDSARSKRKRRAGSIFVPSEPLRGGPGLPRGIWERKGKTIAPLFIFVRGAPSYGRDLRFQETARKTTEARLEHHFERAFRRAIETARR